MGALGTDSRASGCEASLLVAVGPTLAFWRDVVPGGQGAPPRKPSGWLEETSGETNALSDDKPTPDVAHPPTS